MIRRNGWLILLFVLAVAGAIDAGYLTYEHFSKTIPPCTTGAFADCGKVLTSSYSMVFGIPLALLGVVHYTIEAVVLLFVLLTRKTIFRLAAIVLSTAGLLSSTYFVYLMLFVIGAICWYCLLSAAISFLLFVLAINIFARERRFLIVHSMRLGYKLFLKPLFFLLNPEYIHERMTQTGHVFGLIAVVRKFITFMLGSFDSRLYQKVAGISFASPIGLAAGFDYDAQLPNILPSIGFGFGTVGTITNHRYGGNPSPMLGRLPKSKSLMVNKGFKNMGAIQTIKQLSRCTFDYPVGVSIGRTNTPYKTNQKQSVNDIVVSLSHFESSRLRHAYYELNISCPNLLTDINFYSSKNLNELLTAVDKLNLKRPLFIKMPIDKTDVETEGMLNVIAKHSVAGVIIGNLQKNRKDKSLDQKEVARFPMGNFSGKPCFDRSNELISLCYKKFGKRFTIIGCGGVFSANDAYEKIKRGATLVQLITGMIFEGPQLIAQINMELPQLASKDGFSHISQAIGSKK